MDDGGNLSILLLSKEESACTNCEIETKLYAGGGFIPTQSYPKETLSISSGFLLRLNRLKFQYDCNESNQAFLVDAFAFYDGLYGAEEPSA